MKGLRISSASFGYGETIPERYTGYGKDTSPPLVIENIPEGTKSLVLWLDDPDALFGVFTHWIVYNIPPSKTRFDEDEKLNYPHAKNDFGDFRYQGPHPPAGKPHRYHFKVYALDEELHISEGSDKREVKKLMAGHVIDEATLVGVYGRK